MCVIERPYTCWVKPTFQVTPKYHPLSIVCLYPLSLSVVFQKASELFVPNPQGDTTQCSLSPLTPDSTSLHVVLSPPTLLRIADMWFWSRRSVVDFQYCFLIISVQISKFLVCWISIYPIPKKLCWKKKLHLKERNRNKDILSILTV